MSQNVPSNLTKGTHASIGTFGKATLRPVDELSSEYYVNLEVLDRHGVLARVAGVFGSHEVSIRSMEQEALDPEAPERGDRSGTARLIFITHAAREADVRATLHDLRGLEEVVSVGSVLRVVGGR